jgi:hypothetical protein
MPALLACCLLASFVQLPSLPIEIATMRAALSGVLLRRFCALPISPLRVVVAPFCNRHGTIMPFGGGLSITRALISSPCA